CRASPDRLAAVRGGGRSTACAALNQSAPRGVRSCGLATTSGTMTRRLQASSQHVGGERMQYVGMVMPVLPGKTDRAKRFGHEVMQNRLAEHDRTHRGTTMVRDSIWLQHTPMGDLLIDYVEASDLMLAFQQFVTGTDP